MSRASESRQYPEHQKLHTARERWRTIQDFLAWTHREHQFQFASPGSQGAGWDPTTLSDEQLLAEYFGIDLEKVHQEDQAMQDSHAKTSGVV